MDSLKEDKSIPLEYHHLDYKLDYRIQGVPKKVSVKPIFKFQTLGGVFFGVKNNSKNFGNKKIVGSLAKF